MARITLELTEEQLAVIRCMRFRKIDVKHERANLLRTVTDLDTIVERMGDKDDPKTELLRDGLYEVYKSMLRSKQLAEEDRDKYYGFDTYDLFNGMKPYEFLAFIFGDNDKIIKGTEEDYDGPKFPPDVIERYEGILGYIYDRLVDIEDLIHQRCDRGGIQAGVKYIALDHERIWRTEEEFEEYRKKK